MVDISKEMCLLIHLLAKKKKDHDPLGQAVVEIRYLLPVEDCSLLFGIN
jgi:hypothetical protein